VAAVASRAAASSFPAQRVRDPGQPLYQSAVEGVLRRGPGGALPGDLLDLQPGRGPAVAGRTEQGLRELAVGLRHRSHAPGDGGGGLLALGGHQVEELAHILHPAINHVEVAGGVPGVIALHGQGQPLLHRGPCGLLAQPRCLGPIKGREGRAIQPGPFGEPVSTQIRQLTVVSGDPSEGGEGRVQGSRPLHIILGDAVDRTHIEDRSLILLLPDNRFSPDPH